ncbi:carbohydrate porin [Sphingomonas sp. PAMC 26621]|uniref:carbohydrate porin n=1 Tax=Sphingomonas sp. PAMC 26621 TaxID=1112213 RepID=UPI0002886480|nr:carbohydrate porin [Sphingomonas sp. PAMC 26621]
MIRELMTMTAAVLAVSATMPAVAQTVAPTASAPQTRDKAPGDQSLSPVQDLPAPAAPARVPEGEQPFPQSDYLMGDLGGIRNSLAARGVSLSFGLVNEVAYNPAGGTSEKVAYADQLSFAVKADMGKLAGLTGGVFTLNISDRNGKNLSDIAQLGTLQEVQEIFGRGNVARISELSYAQDLFGGTLNVKGGRLDIGDDFVAFSCKFQNLTFCYFTPDHIAGDNFFAYPVSQWAVRAKLKLAKDVSLKVGVYDINTKLADKSGGFSFNTSRSIGSDTMTELAWTPKLGPAGLPGTFKGGFWYSSARRSDLFLDANGLPQVVTGTSPLTHKGYFGYWLQAQQQLTGGRDGSSRGLTAFANFVQTDHRVVAVNQVINVGLFYVGAFASRPFDEIGIAVGRSRVSDVLRQAQLLRNATFNLAAPVQRSEIPVEVYYSLNIGKAIAIRPNVQYVRHPGGTAANKDAVILGLKNVITF